MEALLHMDMNAFFAAVEVRDRPALERRSSVQMQLSRYLRSVTG
ncbi:MAG: hypothetical protein SVU32_05585 [Candidatus Nanohaloarchaea archaeon]|nr:hypothetical protein [Candidatus Nanohaloarchaea archaeon]